MIYITIHEVLMVNINISFKNKLNFPILFQIDKQI